MKSNYSSRTRYIATGALMGATAVMGVGVAGAGILGMCAGIFGSHGEDAHQYAAVSILCGTVSFGLGVVGMYVGLDGLASNVRELRRLRAREELESLVE